MLTYSVGTSVALDGNNALVGSGRANNNEGAAYLYTLTSSTPLTTLTPVIPATSDAAASDQFGTSVALSGNDELIGAPGKNSDEGAAYLFEDGAIAFKYSDPGAMSGDEFGHSVALSDNNALVGAYGTNNEAGAAYLYNLTRATPVLTYRDTEGVGGDYFGYSVALSDNNALVGAYGVGPNANSGAAYLYNLTSNTPVLSLSDPESAPEVEFGYSVALNDNYVLVGAPGAEEGTPGSRTSQGAAYLYNLTSATPVLTYSDPGATTGDSFGTSVALDGTSVLVGAPGTNNAEGAAYFDSLTGNGCHVHMSLWDRERSAEGAALVERALRAQGFGAYTIQAAIAAVGAEAPDAR